MNIKSKIRYMIPGILVSEETVEDIDHRDPHMVKMPRSAYAFQFFDIQTIDGVLEDGSRITNEKKINESKMYYPGARLFTAEEVSKLPRHNQILLDNMRCNGCDAIRTRLGNWVKYQKDTDVIL